MAHLHKIACAKIPANLLLIHELLILFVLFAVICNLKNEFYSVRVRFLNAYGNLSRDIMDVRGHLKQRHAAATCKGIRVSVPISSKCPHIE